MKKVVVMMVALFCAILAPQASPACDMTCCSGSDCEPEMTCAPNDSTQAILPSLLESPGVRSDVAQIVYPASPQSTDVTEQVSILESSATPPRLFLTLSSLLI